MKKSSNPQNEPPQKTLIDLPLSNCSECPLYNQHSYNPHNYWGNDKSPKILFIGEAPGKEEKTRGKAFQGRAGKYLLKVLNKLGFEESDYFMANTVACRPEKETPWGSIKDRKPTNKEIKACSDNLDAIIAHVKPQYIVPLGATASTRLKVRGGILKTRGTLVENSYGKIFPCLHPAYILRSPNFSPQFEEDLSILKRLIDGEYERPQVDFEYLIPSSLKEVKEMAATLKKASTFSFDFETTGFDPVTKQILGCAFCCDESFGYYLPLICKPESSLAENPRLEGEYYQYWEEDDQEIVRSILDEILSSYPARKVAHNGKFDVKFGEVNRGIKVKSFFADTMLMHYILDENRPHDLKYCCAELFPEMRNYDDELNQYLKQKDRDNESYGEVPLPVLGKYGAYDAIGTYKLYNALKEKFTDSLKKILFDFYMPLSRAYIEFEKRGTQVDVDHVKSLIKEFTTISEAELAKVYELAGQEFNLNSSPQLGKVLYEDMGLPITKMTDAGNASTDEFTLVTLKKDYPHLPGTKLVSHILKFREAEKLLSTNLKPILIRKDHKNRIHPSYLLHGTVTGRLSSKKPNIQNIPRDPRIRGIFVAPEDYYFVEIDYSQVELRVMAYYSQDKAMMSAYLNNEDIHTNTAAFIFHIEKEAVDKWKRKRAKLVNFGYVYGAQARKALDSILEKLGDDEEPPTLKEMEKFREGFFTLYSGVDRFIKKIHRQIMKKGYVENCFGRIRRLHQAFSPMEEKQAEARREGLNALIQSTASDITQRAYIKAHNLLKDKKSNVLFTVHDAIMFEIHRSEMHLIPELKAIMEVSPPEFPMPLIADVEIFPERWGNDSQPLEKWKDYQINQ